MTKSTKPTKSTKSVAELKKFNENLISENAKLKKQVMADNIQLSKKNHFFRNVVVFMCVVLSSAILIVGNVLFWAGNTVVDTNKFVATVNPLIEDPIIQQSVAKYTTDKLFARFDVEQTLIDVLPPRADFLAPVLTKQLQTTTQTNLEKILANDSKFQKIWKDTIKGSHEMLISYVKEYKGDGKITLSNIYQKLSDELQNTKLSFLANKKLPASVGNVTVANFPGLPVAHNIVNNIGLYQLVTTLLVIGFAIIAIFLSANRRKTVISIGVMVSIFMALSLVAIRIVEYSATNLVQSDYRQAISIAANIISNPLVIQTRVLLMIGLLIAVIAWVSGPYKIAKLTRERIKTLFEGKIHKAIFSKGENKFTLWVGSHKKVLQWSAIAVVAAIMLIVQLSPVLLFWYALLMLILVLIIELLSATK